MKKRIMLSLLALMFCLPMFFTVTACGGETKEILSIVAIAPNKYYVGQNFKDGNPTVVVNYDDGTSKVVTDYTVGSYLNLDPGKKSVIISYKGVKTSIGIEVLTYDEYVDYVIEKLEDHIIQTTNIPTVDSNEESTALLDFSISNVAVYDISDDSKSLISANNGNFWYYDYKYLDDKNSVNKIFWFDYSNNTLYTKSIEKREILYTKERFDTAFEAMNRIAENTTTPNANNLALSTGFSMQALFVSIIDTLKNAEEYKGIYSQNGILELNYEDWSISIDMSNWTVKSIVPTQGIKYEFNCGVDIPTFPTTDWKLVTA